MSESWAAPKPVMYVNEEIFLLLRYVFNIYERVSQLYEAGQLWKMVAIPDSPSMTKWEVLLESLLIYKKGVLAHEA